MAKRRNWVLILFGVAVLLVFLGIGAIVATTAWVQQNLAIEETNAGAAQSKFEAVRDKFAGQPALLDMRDGRPALNPQRTPAPTSQPLEQLHVLVWDPNDQEMASFSLPFWLLRLKSTPIEFSSYASGLDDNGINLRAEDIEKHGPGIILDTTSPSGERVLLWAQ